MAKKSGPIDFEMVSETGNWNVAGDFVRLKVMKPLYEIGEFATKAVFGVTDIENAFGVSDEIITMIRIQSLKHMHHRLTALINDTLFAIKKKPDKELMKNYLESLHGLSEYLPYIEDVVVNQRDNKKMIIINERVFDIVLHILNDIRRDVLVPLNNSDLIFTSVDETDPDELLKKIQEDIVNAG